MITRLILVCSILLGLASPVTAAEGDFHLGSFEGFWCGSDARFDMTSADGWTFWGKVVIHDTGEYDDIRIIQYDDNSLKMRRYLSGANTGKSQRVTTPPPSTRAKGGIPTNYWRQDVGSGLGCTGGTTIWVPIE